MLYDIVRALVLLVIVIAIICGLLSWALGFNIGSEIANYGLKHTIERIWEGPQDR